MNIPEQIDFDQERTQTHFLPSINIPLNFKSGYSTYAQEVKLVPAVLKDKSKSVFLVDVKQLFHIRDRIMSDRTVSRST